MKQTDTPEKFLTGKKLKALDALISYDSIDQACNTCGISRATMYRYLREPLFEKELKAAKRQLINRAILRLQKTCGVAAQTLGEICRDKEATAASRVSAAKEILSNALKALELEDIESRLKALEERMNQK